MWHYSCSAITHPTRVQPVILPSLQPLTAFVLAINRAYYTVTEALACKHRVTQRVFSPLHQTS